MAAPGTVRTLTTRATILPRDSSRPRGGWAQPVLPELHAPIQLTCAMKGCWARRIGRGPAQPVSAVTDLVRTPSFRNMGQIASVLQKTAAVQKVGKIVALSASTGAALVTVVSALYSYGVIGR